VKLIVGLGNPGPKYAGNRHNIGFMVVDELLRRWSGATSSKFSGDYARIQIGKPTAVLKPMTYMNRSGDSVGPCARYFDIEAPEILVVHDELDIPFGDLRVKSGGGHAGHNGLRSIIEHQGADFVRLRVGIGRPQVPVIEHVLSDFSSEERQDLNSIIGRAADAVELAIKDGALAAGNKFNRKKKKKKGTLLHSDIPELKPIEEAE
jgi:PTH1 family peptidyl-tRNA hydrolase